MEFDQINYVIASDGKWMPETIPSAAALREAHADMGVELSEDQAEFVHRCWGMGIEDFEELLADFSQRVQQRGRKSYLRVSQNLSWLMQQKALSRLRTPDETDRYISLRDQLDTISEYLEERIANRKWE